jgi:hypothetical protein
MPSPSLAPASRARGEARFTGLIAGAPRERPNDALGD